MLFEYIVVGAGTAGCVVAARLSERADCRVLLVEAGADIVPEPPSIASPFPVSHAVPALRWPALVATLKAPFRGDLPPVAGPFVQARVVGGGGSLMGMIALRGLPADYDEWRDAGATGWGWDDVLPWFRHLEHDHDFAGDMHGRAGPIAVRRHARPGWSPFAEAVGDAFEAEGFPFVADANGDFRDGHAAVPSSSLPGRRVSSASSYLDAGTRARANLTIMTGAEAQAVLLDGRRATGVRLSTPVGPISISAREVILCAGAIKTPELLLRSGIGPATELRDLGIEPVVDLPSVGRNLANHPAIYLSVWLPRAYRRPGGPFTLNALRYSSGLRDCPPQDMFMPVINRTAWHALGDRIAALGACLYKPASLGRISLRRGDERLSPLIDLGMFADARDLARMTDGFRRIFRHLTQAAAALPGLRIFAPTNNRLMARLAEPRFANRPLASLLSAIVDVPGPLRDMALRRAGVDPSPLMHDDEALAEFVYTHASPMFHPAGTCRIGARGDPAAVVDPRCRVIGIDGLRIADASVMPSLVRANTNIPTIMIGEKVAAMLRSDEAARSSASSSLVGF